jgi:hypothetical protein
MRRYANREALSTRFEAQEQNCKGYFTTEGWHYLTPNAVFNTMVEDGEHDVAQGVSFFKKNRRLRAHLISLIKLVTIKMPIL